jgi:hypothetical protein
MMNIYNSKTLQRSDNVLNKIIYSEFEPIFVFKSPYIGKQGYRGVPIGTTSTYQVFLSTSNPSSFLSGSMSATPLSSVDFYSDIRGLSSSFPAFSAFNIEDFGGTALYDVTNSSVEVNLGALSAQAEGYFIFILTSPGGYIKFPGGGYGSSDSDTPYYIQSMYT